ncbi:MAG: hypothetical protein OJF61_002687 [Rhodanobacteraceae bacterium]|jgi:hypothetical protein|nr:MAG: hypothetical protein OJF61_002687 [Rhodanobacteraceae bacterium]
MNAGRGAAASKRMQRRLVMLMLAVNLAGIAGIVLYTGNAHGLALGLVPLSMLLAALP